MKSEASMADFFLFVLVRKDLIYVSFEQRNKKKVYFFGWSSKKVIILYNNSTVTKGNCIIYKLFKGSL